MPGTAPSLGRRVAIAERLIEAAASLGAAHPGTDPSLYGLRFHGDVPYGDAPQQRLDITAPSDRTEPVPVVLYAHGGGFRLLSKRSHWMMAIAFARRGYLVLNIDYQLATDAPFPGAHRDMDRAWLWALEHAAAYGGDPRRILVAGDSAGANLALSLALQTAIRRPEPWARQVFDAAVQPAAVVGLCGMFELHGLDRLLAGRRAPAAVRRWVAGVERGYLAEPAEAELASPLALLERGLPTERPLPPTFLSVGRADPLLEDSERLHAALRERETPCELHVHDGEGHAFQMLTWRSAAKRSWTQTFSFLDSHGILPPPAPPAAPATGLGERLSTWIRDRLVARLAA